MTALCPCCGGAVESDRILLDASRFIVAYAGREAWLTQYEFSIVQEVIKAYPAAISKDRLFDTIYAARIADGDFPEPKIIDVYICKARKKLIPIGVILTTSWGFGYGVTLADPSAAGTLKEAGLRMRANGGYRWRDEDDDTLRNLADRRMSLQQISAVMHVPYLTVQRAVDRLGVEIGRRSAA
jgi:hypothetical protein